MKKTLFVALLLLTVLAGQAKEKTVVWEQPCTEVNTKIEGCDRLSVIDEKRRTKDESFNRLSVMGYRLLNATKAEV